VITPTHRQLPGAEVGTDEQKQKYLPKMATGRSAPLQPLRPELPDDPGDKTAAKKLATHLRDQRHEKW